MTAWPSPSSAPSTPHDRKSAAGRRRGSRARCGSSLPRSGYRLNARTPALLKIWRHTIHDNSGVPARLTKEFAAKQLDFEGGLQTSFVVACELGDTLQKIKEECRHGEFEKWIKTHCRFSKRRAQEYAQLARQYPADTRTAAKLTIDEALRELRKSRKNAAPEMAGDRLSSDGLAALAKILTDAKSSTLQPMQDALKAEHLPKNHQAYKEAKKIAAALNAFLRFVTDQVVDEVFDEASADDQQDPIENAVKTLGLQDAWPCGKADVESAFRDLVKQVHPDKGGDAEEFIRVQEAFDFIVELFDRGEACPNCGHTEFDGDGDCAKCHEPSVVHSDTETVAA